MAGAPEAAGFEPVIGLEIHAQLLTATKIFCGCRTRFGDPPNTHVCPVCLGLPGALPVLNRRAVEYAARAALALGCTVHRRSIFARKNYFYPDLPKGYQISQYEEPLATDGRLEYPRGSEGRAVGIVRVHLEEDAGKSLHEGFADSDRYTYVDFNRSGVPLIEIVTRPDLRSAADAADCFARLRDILVAIGVNDGNMEEGSLRCDANVSVRRAGQTALGVKTEVKNLNSFRFLQRALEYEIERQIAVLSAGGTLAQETRLWDQAGGRTVTMRTKEEAHDYRYFPEPDLPPLALEEPWIAQVAASLPELPEARRQRLLAQYALPEYDAGQITRLGPSGLEYFERTVAAGVSPKQASNWLLGEIKRTLNEAGLDMPAFAARVSPEALAELVGLVEAGTISTSAGKSIFERMYASGQGAGAIVAAEGLAQISDTDALAALVREVLARHADAVAQYRGGKTGALGFLVGQVMQASGGKANPKLVNALLRRELG